MSHFALRSEQVVTGGQLVAACVEVKDGKISAIHSHDHQPDCPVEELGKLALLPGLVDTHVHINEPGRTEWEGFNTATQAAAAGGITTLVDMPLNCIPVTISKDAFQEKLDSVSDKLWVDCGFWGGVVPDSLDDLDELLAAGVLGVKSFLIDSGIDEFPNVEASHMQKALPILAKYDVPYLIHAELDTDCTPPAEIGESYQSFLASRPKHWENEAVALMVALARQAKENGHDCKVHIVHLSSAEALDSISAAKAMGLQFTAETCPHYLTLVSEEIPDGKTLFKCCPPIREKDNCEILWRAVADGRISFIVSDHSPCTPQLKHIDSGDVEKAWGGISALQFGLPLIWTEARRRGFTLVEIARWMCEQTAIFGGLDKRKGKIAVGMDADFVVFDDETEITISNDMIKHRHKITPYEGKQVCGVINATYLRGQKIYADDQYGDQPLGQPLLKHQL